MSTVDGQAPDGPLSDLADDACFAHAALVIQGRSEHRSVTDAVEYLYGVADDLGVDGVQLARVILEASEGRHSPKRHVDLAAFP